GFYIGSDRVNRTVELPYTFEVVPPFGVENLIVTAFSVKPPPPATIPKRIDGELYQVFNSVKKAISASRGLRRKQGSEVRVGEVMLTLTTMRGEK
ncbi:MAG: hypothetical protein N0E59_21155, partial [Candidatus Thiodiazotropha taylori]|nr:hypothetical protein [Candidatus Thiodiazotropha taylori]MCW4285628.1 hypothetical protein [Candidatus Thiodiazotropha taylori]